MSADLTPTPSLATPQRRHLRLAQSGLAFAVLLLIQVLLLIEAHLGLIDGSAVAPYIAVSTLSSLGLYALVRTGWSERVSSEPSLSMPQMVVAQACTVWAYALAGPGRGALLPLMVLILAFGLFALKEETARGLALLGILMLAVVTGGLALRDPVAAPPATEAAHWLFTAVAMAAMSVLARRLGRMRQRLRERQSELSEALAQIKALATRDALTGLLNRRAMLEELQREARRAARHGHRLSLVLVDLDHFKRVNDSLGHRCGDRVLQTFASLAIEELRSTDRVGRWGGEEFLLMMPQTDPAEARAAVERIRQRLRRSRVDGAPESLVISFSAGLAWCHGEADVDAAIDRADLAMYAAKSAGRDRLISADEGLRRDAVQA
jgi:diguanylate cyclase (GGDEF)-like protein